MGSAVLARNTGLNLIGQIVPLVIGIVAMPMILRGLGTQAFGLLSLAWVILGYTKVFDLGLGPAITRFVAAESTSHDSERLPAVVWTALTFQFFLGLTGAVALAAATPFLVERVFKIPGDLVPAAHTTFGLMAALLPVSLVGAGLKGVLEGRQLFGLVNAIHIPANASLFLLPAMGLRVGLTLPGIMLLLAAARCVMVFAYLVVGLRAVPPLRRLVGLDMRGFRSLLAFGGWVTLANVLGPILLYLDRFLISSIASISMLAYYTASYEIATRLWIVPMGVFVTLFPAFSAIRMHEHSETAARIFVRAVKSLFFLTLPLALVLVTFADGILALWLGEEFARHGAGVLRILGIGVFLSSLAWVPYALMMGIGRPDLHVKIILLVLPLYAVLAGVLIRSDGIAGAAVAWALQTTMYTLLAFASIWRIFSPPHRTQLVRGVTRAFGGFLVVTAGAGIIVFLDVSFLLRSVLLSALVALLMAATWRFVFDGQDRRAVSGVLGVHRGLQMDEIRNSWSGSGP